MKIAIVHEWMREIAGSEKVVQALLQLFPSADLLMLFEKLGTPARDFLAERRVTTSWMQHIPSIEKFTEAFVPLMPLTFAGFDVRDYAVVISSHHTAAKSVLTTPDQHHICYCHSPLRAAWDLQHDYLATLPAPLRPIGLALLHKLRREEIQASLAVDDFVANSTFVAKRIKKYYRRQARVIHPPVAVANGVPTANKDDYFLALGRLVPYKQTALVVSAFKQMPQHKLIVIGDGAEYANLVSLAAGAPNITLRGYQPDSVVQQHLQNAQALVLASIEDFGMTAVEAQACGTPVIGYNAGGITDIIQSTNTGLLYPTRSAETIVAAVERFLYQRENFSISAMVENAQRFAPARFQTAMQDLVARAVSGAPRPTQQQGAD